MPAVEAAAAASAAKADDHAPGSVQAKAQVLVSSGPPVFALRDVALSPTDGSCTLRMLGASICASDLHTAEGRRPAVPSQPDAECTLGHEGVGVVLGADPPTLASGVQVGDTVTFSVASSSCAPTCGRCEVGLPQKCVKLFKYGHEAYRPQAELSGTYGSHMVLQEGSTVVPICRKGEELPASLALCCMMNCSGATAVASARSCGSIENRRVAVFGGGPLGLLIALRAKDLGAKEAAVIDLSPKVIESVKRFGLETELTGEYDAVVEACGAKAVLGPAIKVSNPIVMGECPQFVLNATSARITGTPRGWHVGLGGACPPELGSRGDYGRDHYSQVPHNRWGPQLHPNRPPQHGPVCVACVGSAQVCV